MTVARLELVNNQARPEIPSSLTLREGQRFVGKILSVIQNKVILQLAGYYFEAENAGLPITAGMMPLFEVVKVKPDRIELKILADLSATTEIISRMEEVSPEITVAIERFLAETPSGYRMSLTPKIAAFLQTFNWPVTAGTILLAWFSLDRSLRGKLWNQLSSYISEELLKPEVEAEEIEAWLDRFCRNDYSRSLFDRTNPGKMGKSQISTITETPAETGTQLRTEKQWDEVLTKIRPLLEAGARISKNPAILSDNSGLLGLTPLLIADRRGGITEFCLERQKKRRNAKDETEIISLRVPTENMGDISVNIRINVKQVQIDLQVESSSVQDFLMERREEFLKPTAPNITFTVSVINFPATESVGKVDLWM